jgi:hypothetical protein
MMRKTIVAAGAALLAFASTQAMAQAVSDCSNSNYDLSAGNIQTLLAPAGGFSDSNIFEVDAVDDNDETLVGTTTGAVWDYKLGTGVDPSVQVGTYTIGSGSLGGTIQYTYGSLVYTYYVGVTSETQVPTAAGNFNFCGGLGLPAPTPAHAVTVRVGHQAP